MYVKHRISTGNVEVDYIFTHTNHSPGLEEVKHIPIPTSVQEEIQQKFSQGVSVEKIMKGMEYIMYVQILNISVQTSKRI